MSLSGRAYYSKYIFPKYLKLIKRAMEMVEDKDCMKLKADCWNEAQKKEGIAHLLKNCICIDISSKYIRRASKRYPEVRAIKGSIDKMPFKDGEFGLLIDLSTIDHIADYEKVLDEYKRVLSKKGILLLVSWISLRKDKSNTRKTQYVFNFKKFNLEIENRFNIIKEGIVYERAKSVLYWFICKK